MQTTIHRILSLAILVADYVVAFVGRGMTGLFLVMVVFLIPVACIWFPEQIGGATGYMGRPGLRVTRKTPPLCILVLGWFFLVCLTAVICYGVFL